jgi:hypothetical protein
MFPGYNICANIWRGREAVVGRFTATICGDPAAAQPGMLHSFEQKNTIAQEYHSYVGTICIG